MSGSYYSANPHYAPTDLSEDRERLEKCEQEAGRWFDELSMPQRVRYTQRMRDAQPYRGSPRWDREREAANREFEETTKDAAAVCERVLRDLMLTGEASEVTVNAFEDVKARQQVMQVAAE
jgi:hypothetical protein